MKKINTKSVKFKSRLIIIIVSIVMIAAVEFVMVRSIRRTVEEAELSRMQSDIQYLNEMIGGENWHEEGGVLYCGDVLIGDGTEENAYLEPFLTLEEKTGSFSYAFVRVPDEGLTWVGDSRTGYQQGHYMRVSGSTLNANGTQIIGTYMDKEVADVLDAGGMFVGRARVVDSTVFCLYYVIMSYDFEPAGVLVVGRSIDEIEAQTFRTARIMFYIVTIAVIIAVAIMNTFLSSWLSKLDKANHYLLDISTGYLPNEPLELNTKDELDVTAQCINEMTAALKEKSRISGELEAAANIQHTMLPRKFPAFPDRDEFDVFAAMHPAKEVGGDFYDFFMVDEDHLAVAVADVSGKGVPAALFMAIAKMLIKNHTQMGLQPREVFTRVNRLLNEGNETCTFVTAWMGILDLKSGTLTYVNAGHNSPLVKLSGGGFRYLVMPAGCALGAFGSTEYGQSEISMEPGDSIFLYTDGVTEAMNEEEKLYGTKRLNEYLNAHASDSTEDILRGLKADIDRFSGMHEQFDDITMLMLRFQKKSSPADVREHVFEASGKAIPEILTFTENVLTEKKLQKETVNQILTAVEEIALNISDYAYPGKDGSMEICLEIMEKAVKIRFTDSGIPFDPMKAPEPDVTLPVADRSVGGLGIFMVRRSMDGLSYERRDGKNIFTITKKI